MTWQRRAQTQHRYYLQRYCENGKQHSRYLGRGPAALLAAREDARRRAEREAAWLAGRSEEHQLAAASEPLDTWDDDMQFLVKAALFASGFHQEDRHWRPNSHATR